MKHLIEITETRRRVIEIDAETLSDAITQAASKFTQKLYQDEINGGGEVIAFAIKELIEGGLK